MSPAPVNIVLPMPRTWKQWTLSATALSAAGVAVWGVGHWAYMRHEQGIVEIGKTCGQVKDLVGEQKTQVAKLATGFDAQAQVLVSLDHRVGELTTMVVQLAMQRQVATAGTEPPSLIAAPFPRPQDAASARLAGEGGLR
jgi:hypothetical protein